jgi:transcriptional regulator with XRE-family HTH domain
MLSTRYIGGIMNFMALLAELRDAVQKDERTQLAIAEAARIHRTTFSAFMNGRRGLSVDTVEQLAKALGYTLTLTKVKPKPK